MPRYLIAFDLLKPGQVYEDLLPALQKLGAKQVLLSLWVVDSSLKAEEIRDWVRRYVDSHDRLVVCQVTEFATYRAMNESS
jgi:hypothetical protein